MEEPNETAGVGLGPEGSSKGNASQASRTAKSKKNKGGRSLDSQQEGSEVLLRVGPFKYRMPGKRQKVIVSATVFGLNALLLVAVLLYFYNPSFKEFIFTVGRN